MPFKHAHWLVVALLPVIALAFWPAYFGNLRGASVAFHAHGLSASAWILLVAWQSWTIHSGRRALHRSAGQALFVIVPLFAIGGTLAMHSMAVKFATHSDPFYAVLGARLGLHDLLSTVVLVGMVCAALVYRRRPALHAGYMLATVLLVLPPVVARLPIPRFFHSGEVIAIGMALLAMAWERRGLPPLAIVVVVQLLQILQFETIGASTAWANAFTRFSGMPVVPFAAAAGAAALASLLAAWRLSGRTRVRVEVFRNQPG